MQRKPTVNKEAKSLWQRLNVRKGFIPRLAPRPRKQRREEESMTEPRIPTTTSQLNNLPTRPLSPPPPSAYAMQQEENNLITPRIQQTVIDMTITPPVTSPPPLFVSEQKLSKIVRANHSKRRRGRMEDESSSSEEEILDQDYEMVTQLSPTKRMTKFWELCYGSSQKPSTWSAQRAPPSKSCLQPQKSTNSSASVQVQTPVLRRSSKLDFLTPSPHQHLSAETPTIVSSRKVQFGISEAVEYEADQPTLELTKIPSIEARERFPITEKTISEEEIIETGKTKHNSAILAEWEGDVFLKKKTTTDKTLSNKKGKKRRKSRDSRRDSRIFSSPGIVLLEDSENAEPNVVTQVSEKQQSPPPKPVKSPDVSETLAHLAVESPQSQRTPPRKTIEYPVQLEDEGRTLRDPEPLIPSSEVANDARQISKLNETPAFPCMFVLHDNPVPMCASKDLVSRLLDQSWSVVTDRLSGAVPPQPRTDAFIESKFMDKACYDLHWHEMKALKAVQRELKTLEAEIDSELSFLQEISVFPTSALVLEMEKRLVADRIDLDRLAICKNQRKAELGSIGKLLNYHALSPVAPILATSTDGELKLTLRHLGVDFHLQNALQFGGDRNNSVSCSLSATTALELTQKFFQAMICTKEGSIRQALLDVCNSASLIDMTQQLSATIGRTELVARDIEEVSHLDGVKDIQIHSGEDEDEDVLIELHFRTDVQVLLRYDRLSPRGILYAIPEEAAFLLNGVASPELEEETLKMIGTSFRGLWEFCNFVVNE